MFTQCGLRFSFRLHGLRLRLEVFSAQYPVYSDYSAFITANDNAVSMNMKCQLRIRRLDRLRKVLHDLHV